MPIKSQHSRTFEKLLAEYRQSIADAVCAGLPEAEYRERVGELRGLETARLLSEQADRELSGD